MLIKACATFGTDPELFVTSQGRVIGCEKVLKKGDKITSGSVSIINDGVQMEINVPPQGCRTNMQTYLKQALSLIKGRINEINHKNKGADLDVSLSPSVIDVDQNEWETLTEESKILGCMPSLNVHDKDARIPEGSSESRMRSAGGHLHLAMYHHDFHPDLIHLFDLVIGNTCVLLDREERAAERRQVYGRAGEYRLPPHGVEYRTLSNFWLAQPVLVHLVLGLLKFCNGLWMESRVKRHLDPAILHATTGQWVNAPTRLSQPDLLPSLMEGVNHAKVRDAINHNSLDLAQENFDLLKSWIMKNVGDTFACGGINNSHMPPLRPDNILAFETFVKKPHKYLPKPDRAWAENPHQGIDRFLQDLR